MALSFSSKKAYSQRTMVVPNTSNMATSVSQPVEDVSLNPEILRTIYIYPDIDADPYFHLRVYRFLAAHTLEPGDTITCN
jgi:hypothetical protein